MGNQILKINEIIRKNSAIAPGLTIVNWCNNQRIIQVAEQIKIHYDENFADVLSWYENEHLHMTLSALTLTKYQQFFPLKAFQLPGNICEVTKLISSQSPFEVTLSHYALKENGQIQIEGKVNELDEKILLYFRTLTQKLDPGFQYLNRPKIINNQIHINLGYFNSLPKKVLNPEEVELDNPISLQINSVSIVHYLKRTLETKYLCGTLNIPLGQEESISSDLFYKTLNIN